MRNLIYSIGALNGNHTRYTRVILNSIKLDYIFSQYKMPLYCIVFDTILNKEVAFDLAQVKAEAEVRNETLSEYLKLIETKPLVYLDEVPRLNTRYMRYADVFYAGFSVNKTASLDVKAESIKDSWAILKKDNIDYAHLFKTSLITVNGYIHQTDYNSQGLYVVDAYDTVSRLGQNHLGIMNTNEFSNLTFKYFNKDITVKLSPEYNGVFFSFNEDMSQKKPIFVIGGRLFINTPFLKQHDTNIYYLDLKLMDFESFVFDIIPLLKQHPIIKHFNEKQYSGLKYDVLNTQELLLSIFNLSQSFVFFLDVDDFFVEPIYLTIDKNANWIETQYVPDKPLMGYQGEVLDYHWKYGWDDHYLLLLQKPNYEKMIATTTPDLINLSKQLDPNKPFIKQKPYYLHFGVDID